MNAPILNRNFQHPADGWYHIEPKGVHPNVESKVVQVIDAKALKTIADTFNQEADEWKAKHGVEFPGMLIDHEHFKHDPSKESRAYGWLMRIEARTDGLYGQINWSDTGKKAVDGSDYRFFSTEYPEDGFEILGKEGDADRVRPLRLSGLTLTNDPNNKGGKPITNRKLSPENPESHPAGSNQADTQKKRIMSKIAKKLGLSAEASEDAMLEKIDALIKQAEKAEASEKETEVVKNRLASLESEQLETELTAAGITDAETRKELLPSLKVLTNREARAGFLKRLKPAAAVEVKLPLTNRATAKTPGAVKDGDDAAPTQADNARAVRIRNRASELRNKNKGISLNAAYSQATAQVDAEIGAGK